VPSLDLACALHQPEPAGHGAESKPPCISSGTESSIEGGDGGDDEGDVGVYHDLALATSAACSQSACQDSWVLPHGAHRAHAARGDHGDHGGHGIASASARPVRPVRLQGPPYHLFPDAASPTTQSPAQRSNR
jgi:hypothetical protein